MKKLIEILLKMYPIFIEFIIFGNKNKRKIKKIKFNI